MMNWRKLRRACVALVLSQALAGNAAAKAPTIQEQWAEFRPHIEPTGVTFAMFQSVSLWLEQQYLLGACYGHLAPGDVAYWRTWWDDTGLRDHVVMGRFIRGGDDLYNRGLDAASKENFSAARCQRVFDKWTVDMKAANKDAEADVARFRSGH